MAAELLNIGGDGDRLDVIQPEAVVFAPIEELLDRSRIGRPGLTIPDGRGEELDKVPGFAVPGRNDRRWQLFMPARIRRLCSIKRQIGRKGDGLRHLPLPNAIARSFLKESSLSC